MKKIIIASLFTLSFLSLPSIAGDNLTHINKAFGLSIGQDVNFSQYKSTTGNVVIDGKTMPSLETKDDLFHYTPTQTDFGIAFDEYNLVPDKTGKKLSGILTSKQYESQPLCQIAMLSLSKAMTARFGLPQIDTEKVVYFSDSENPFKTASVICSDGNLNTAITDTKLR